jgi:hypothetical protein
LRHKAGRGLSSIGHLQGIGMKIDVMRDAGLRIEVFENSLWE